MRAKSTESVHKVQNQSSKTAGRNTVNRHISASAATDDYLYLDSEQEGENGARMVCDQGSQIQCAQVFMQGVPAEGLIDSGAEIPIMGSQLFKKVATVNRFKKKDCKKPDRIPKTYVQ